MNYEALYKKLVDKAQNRSLDSSIYVEKHHIVPKCMGGSNAKDNLVYLTAREHFLAHRLLVRIYPTVKGVWYALIAMGRIVEFKSKIFESERLRAYEMRRGFKYSEESKLKMSLAKKGKASNSPETQFKPGLTSWNVGKFGEEHHLFGSKRTEATRAKMSAAQKACGNIPPSRKGVRMTEEQKAKNRFMRSVKKLQPMLAEFQSIY
jgi:hypothetical protein